MDLIDRYLIAVRRHLPRPRQDDIVSELSDSLRSEVEDREQALNRPLNEAEQAELLKQRGHPWLMASRYLPQQHLVGPALYPYYRQALTMVVFWIVLPITLLGGALTAIYADHPMQVWGRVIGAAWNGAIYSVGIVTIVFAVLERERVRFTALDKWDPSWLPTASEAREVPRSESVLGLAFGFTFLIWWIDLVRVPQFMSYDGAPVTFTMAPIWTTMYLPILVSLLAWIAIQAIDLVRPWRSLAVSIVDIGLNMLNLVLIAIILRAGHFVDVVGARQAADRAADLERLLNNTVQGTFIVIGVISVYELLYELWHISKVRRSAELGVKS
jgi:hypothetical protein